jgi:hypothetical protein
VKGDEMKAIFHDHRAITLDKLKVGEIAVEVRPYAREGETAKRRIFAKVWAPNRTVDGILLGGNHEIIIELTDLQNQYLDKLNKSANGILCVRFEEGESVEFKQE